MILLTFAWWFGGYPSIRFEFFTPQYHFNFYIEDGCLVVAIPVLLDITFRWRAQSDRLIEAPDKFKVIMGAQSLERFLRGQTVDYGQFEVTLSQKVVLDRRQQSGR